MAGRPFFYVGDGKAMATGSPGTTLNPTGTGLPAARRDISLVIPCYNEEEALPHLYAELCRVRDSMPSQNFEFIFVDDGSADGTLAYLRVIAEQDTSVRYISFSRNFGKEAALLAGLEAALGRCVGVIDADLQDPPSLIPEMWAALESGEWDCVATRRASRTGEPFIRSVCARLFYRLMARISDAGIRDGARDFRLMTRQVCDAILSMGEYNRFSKGIFSWVGFRTKWLEFEDIKRVAGKTKWSFWGLFVYSLEGITAFILASVFGLLFCFVSVVMTIIVVIKTLIWGDPVAGYPSLMSVVLFIGGVQLFCIGILGQYLAKVYLETKRRPGYIVKEQK